MNLKKELKERLLEHWNDPGAKAMVGGIIDKVLNDLFKEHESGYCEMCGARAKKYTHSLSSGLVKSFMQFATHLRDNGLTTANAVNESGLDVNAATNFQKIQYFGLVAKAGKAGHWFITDAGKAFLRGQLRIYNKRTTFRGSVTEELGELVGIKDYDYEPMKFQKDFREQNNF